MFASPVCFSFSFSVFCSGGNSLSFCRFHFCICAILSFPFSLPLIHSHTHLLTLSLFLSVTTHSLTYSLFLAPSLFSYRAMSVSAVPKKKVLVRNKSLLMPRCLRFYPQIGHLSAQRISVNSSFLFSVFISTKCDTSFSK